MNMKYIFARQLCGNSIDGDAVFHVISHDIRIVHRKHDEESD